MYGMVLLAALCGAEESACHGKKKDHPPPVFDGGGYPGYHNHGGWGRPYGGYGWAGYYCPENWHVRPPAVTLPFDPLVIPPTVPQTPSDEDDEEVPDDRAPKKSNGNGKNGTEVAKFGLTVADLTDPRRRYLGYPADATGVVVGAIDPKGIADRGGLRAGMLILSVDGAAVTTAKQADDALTKGSLREGIRLRIIDPLGERRSVTLKE
jgi:PDZ domain